MTQHQDAIFLLIVLQKDITPIFLIFGIETYLLISGYVFQNLISVFHTKTRPYTLLPNTASVEAVDYGGLPGKIERIIGQNLYENIGQSGLRDLGDLEFIDDFRFHAADSTEKNAPVSLKMAHFISLYLLVFTILIGRRSRNLEMNNTGADHLTTAWKYGLRAAQLGVRKMHPLSKTERVATAAGTSLFFCHDASAVVNDTKLKPRCW